MTSLDDYFKNVVTGLGVAFSAFQPPEVYKAAVRILEQMYQKF